jgi:hypothetical protein
MTDVKNMTETDHIEAPKYFGPDHQKHPELELPEDILKSDAPVHGDWTPEEERKARRKYHLSCPSLLTCPEPMPS